MSTVGRAEKQVRSRRGENVWRTRNILLSSDKDQDFAERLHADLQAKGVRVWFAPHDLKPGDLLRRRIDEAIRVYDKLLLILSEHSVTSTWVEFEVEAALEKEKQRGDTPTVLFPIRLDATVMTCATYLRV